MEFLKQSADEIFSSLISRLKTTASVGYNKRESGSSEDTTHKLYGEVEDTLLCIIGAEKKKEVGKKLILWQLETPPAEVREINGKKVNIQDYLRSNEPLRPFVATMISKIVQASSLSGDEPEVRDAIEGALKGLLASDKGWKLRSYGDILVGVPQLNQNEEFTTEIRKIILEDIKERRVGRSADSSSDKSYNMYALQYWIEEFARANKGGDLDDIKEMPEFKKSATQVLLYELDSRGGHQSAYDSERFKRYAEKFGNLGEVVSAVRRHVIRKLKDGELEPFEAALIRDFGFDQNDTEMKERITEAIACLIFPGDRGASGWTDHEETAARLGIAREDPHIQVAAVQCIGSFVGKHSIDTPEDVKKISQSVDYFNDYFKLKKSDTHGAVTQGIIQRIYKDGASTWARLAPLAEKFDIKTSYEGFASAAESYLKHEAPDADAAEATRQRFGIPLDQYERNLHENIRNRVLKDGLRGWKFSSTQSLVAACVSNPPTEKTPTMKGAAETFLKTFMQSARESLSDDDRENVIQTAKVFDVRPQVLYPRAVGLLLYFLQSGHPEKGAEVERILFPESTSPPEVLTHMFELTRPNESLIHIYRYNRDHGSVDRALSAVGRVTDGHISLSGYQKIAPMLQGITEEEREAWIAKMKLKVGEVRKAILGDDPNELLPMLESPILASYFKNFVRFEKGRFGVHTDALLKKIVEHLVAADPELREAPMGYSPETVQIRRKIEDKVVFLPQFKGQYISLLDSIIDAKREMQANPKTALLRMVRTMRKLVGLLQSDIEEQLAVLGKQDVLAEGDQARERNHRITNLETRLSNLKKIDFPHIRDTYKEAFLALHSEGKRAEANALLREIAFLQAFRMHPGLLDHEFEAFNRENPPSGEIAQVQDFTFHVTYKETWRAATPPKTKKEKKTSEFADYDKALANLLKVGVLEEQMAKFASKASDEEISLKVIPSRSTLFAFSGYMADACWAGRDADLLKNYPNILALAFMKDADTPDEQVAGATLLIEDEAADGTKLIIIRGLNPLMNIIDELDARSFIRELVKYLTPIGKARGRRIAISIDDHSGGHGTNRPQLHDFMYRTLRGELKKTPLGKESTATFNGYDITDETYLFPED